MQLLALVLSWVKRVAAPLLGSDPRPLALRDTLPDQSRPTVPQHLARSADNRSRIMADQAGEASNLAK